MGNEISGVNQLQVKNVTADGVHAGSATIQVPPSGGNFDMDKYESAGVDAFIERGAADTNIDVIVEKSHDGVIWRNVETTNLAVTAGVPTNSFAKVYAMTRQFFRVRFVNNTANALLNHEYVLMKKPFS